MTCKYKVKIKDIQYNYKVQMTDIQSKYKFKIFCTGYDDSEIKDKIDAMYQAFPKVSGEGETITLNDTANTTMAIDLKGNTSQEGTPQDIHVVSGDNSIDIVGKNHFNKDIGEWVARYLTATGTWGGNNALMNIEFIKVEPNTTYTHSWEFGELVNSMGWRQGMWQFCDKNKTPYSRNANQESIGDNSVTFTTDSNCYYVRVAYYGLKKDGENVNVDLTNHTYSDYIKNTQIEKGATATTYQEYKGASYPINLGDIELENGDSIQKINNSWNIVRNNATIEPITDTTLIGQLEALKKAQSYSGQTNISQVNNDAPFTISATALMDLSNLGTSTANTLSTTNINRLETTSIRSSISPDNLEVNNSEETPEEE